MGIRVYSLLAIFFALAFAGLAYAQTTSQGSLSSFLTSFNVSSSTQNALVYTNISYNGGNYLLAYYNGAPYLLINATSAYSFILSPTAITPIITPTIIQSSVAQINASYLSNTLIAYNKSSSGPLLDCIQETGLNQPNASCSSANFCESCRTVPVCSQVLSATGYGSPFQIGIQLLESNYTSLINNIAVYQSSLVQLQSASTAQSALVNLQQSFNNISSVTQYLYLNPVFPPQPNSVCNSQSPPTIFNPKQPAWTWLGFCQTLTYNYTKLNNLQSYITRIEALPTSSKQISGISQSISTNGNRYALVILTSQELKQRNTIDNTTLAGYAGIAAGVSSLSVSINNLTLATRFSTLSANYSLLQSSYTTANLVALNAALTKQYASLKAIYLSLNSSYYSALKTSQNNTALLLSLESESKTPEQQVITLSFREAKLNSLLASRPSDINSIALNLSSLNSQIKQVPHTAPILSVISRSVGVPFASVLLGSSSFSSETSNAPLAAVIPSIIISLLILLALYLVYKRLHKHGRIRHAHTTNRNWKALFVIVAVILLFYIFESYSAAVTANASAPLSSAASAIGYSKSVAIAINGTSNSYLVACENKIAGVLTSQSKTVNKITINGQACTTGSGIQTTDECLGHYMATGVPVIILTNSTRNLLTAYSFYGTVLSQSGNQQFTNACLASLFLG